MGLEWVRVWEDGGKPCLLCVESPASITRNLLYKTETEVAMSYCSCFSRTIMEPCRVNIRTGVQQGGTDCRSDVSKGHQHQPPSSRSTNAHTITSPVSRSLASQHHAQAIAGAGAGAGIGAEAGPAPTAGRGATEGAVCTTNLASMACTTGYAVRQARTQVKPTGASRKRL